MTYTFDEAVEELRLAIPEKFYSPTMHDIAVMLEAQNKVINVLSEEYAPTIEMTKEQLHVLNSYREPDLYDGDYVFNAFYEDTHTLRLGLVNNNLYDNLTEKQLMQAWLHPETIKAVDL